MEYVFIDMETTGLEPENSHITSLGATKVVNGKTLANFATYINCHKHITQPITNVTGIFEEHLVGAPNISEALKAFFEFCRGCTTVCYNLPFADKFLKYHAEKCGIDYDGIFKQKIDVLSLVKEKIGEELKRKGSLSFLRHVADYFGIPHYLNDCLSQAILLSKVYGKLNNVI